MTRSLAVRHLSDSFISSPARLFILALKWMNAPPTARRGILAGEIGMVLAIGGTLLQLGIEGKTRAHRHPLQVDFCRAGYWHRHRRPARHGADDGGAAADRAQPCLRRILRHAGRHRRVLSRPTPGHTSLQDVGAVLRSHPRRTDGHRQLNGRGKTARSSAAAADHVTKDKTSLIWRCWRRSRIAVYLVHNPGATHLYPVMVGIALIFGVMLVIPIGGADMPTVISLLNSYAGFLPPPWGSFSTTNC